MEESDVVTPERVFETTQQKKKLKNINFPRWKHGT